VSRQNSHDHPSRADAESREQVITELFEEWRLLGVVNDIADQAVADYFGVNRTDARCLDIIERRGGVTAGELAVESGLSTGAVTTVLDRLERAGYARRVPDPADRRRVRVEITPEAQRINEELYHPLVMAAHEQLARYSQDELELLRDYHRASRAVTEAHAARVRARLADRQGDEAAS
jgi:DNA-binding MarR family transcriptional regulator